MARLRELLLPFAQSIHAKARALDELEMTKSQTARFREAISDDIKKCTNFITPKVSRAALAKAAPLGVDLCSKNCHDQHGFDPTRRDFHFEHIVPVSAIREACLKKTSASGVLSILMTRLRVVWILKKEDSELTRLGYRSRRNDPALAYRAAGIMLAKRIRRRKRGRV